MSSFLTQILGTGTGQYFADQNGAPFLVRGDSIWGLAVNAGVNGGSTTWESDIGLYMSTRASQGFNSAIVSAVCTTDVTGIDADGYTWDGVEPWTGGTIGDMNSNYWERVDLCVSTAETYGITVFMCLADEYAMPGRTSGAPLYTATGTTITNYGTALAGRYAASPNIVWLFGNDYYGDNDGLYTDLLTALQGAGDTHLVTIENLTEGDSRFEADGSVENDWGTAHAQFNLVYTYCGVYPVVEYSYKESSPLCVLYGDGWYDGDNPTVQDSRDFMRNQVWWGLTSGSRGYIYGRGSYGGTDLWAWNAGASSTLTTNTFDNSDLNSIWNTYASFGKWQDLVPDTSDLLVTGGRGTALGIAATNDGLAYTGYSGGANFGSGQNYYVTASKTPDGTLALLYLPDATGTQNGGPVTINQSKMAPGYTATWVDPVTGAKTTTAAGSSYSTEMTNSLGENDFVLALQAPGTGPSGPPLYGFRS